MLKQILIFVSLVQVIHCSSLRSNNRLHIDQEYPNQGCSFDADNKNPLLEEKICGYCYAKCQQNFGRCLAMEIIQPDRGSLELCEQMLSTCHKTCLNDKKVGRIAQMKWPLVLKFIRKFIALSASNDEKKH